MVYETVKVSYCRLSRKRTAAGRSGPNSSLKEKNRPTPGGARHPEKKVHIEMFPDGLFGEFEPFSILWQIKQIRFINNLWNGSCAGA